MSKLKCFWLFILFAGLVVAILGVIAFRDSWAETLLILGGGALIGFASSAFFSRREQFLLRGVKDRVYLVKNHPYYPLVYQLADRKTFAAFGGIWSEVQHISEGLIENLYRWFGKGKLSLLEAKLYRLGNEEEKSVFAVLLDVRYGVPDPDTQKSIWGAQQPEAVDISELDKWLPGGDLVSKQYWSEKDRGDV